MIFGALKGEGAERVHVYKDNVLIPESAATTAMQWVLKHPVAKPIIATFMHKALDDHRVLADAAGTAHRDLPHSLSELEAFLIENRNRPIIIVAHYEKDEDALQIKTPGPPDTWPKFRRADILMLKNKHHLILEFLACEVGRNDLTNGPVDELFTPQVAVRIGKALQATTYGDLLAALGTKQSPFAAKGVEIEAAFLVLKYTQSLMDLNAAITHIESATHVHNHAASSTSESSSEPGSTLLDCIDYTEADLLKCLEEKLEPNAPLDQEPIRSSRVNNDSSPILRFVVFFAVVAGFVVFLANKISTPPADSSNKPIAHAGPLTAKLEDVFVSRRIQEERHEPWRSQVETIQLAFAKGHVDVHEARRQLSAVIKDYLERNPGIAADFASRELSAPPRTVFSLGPMTVVNCKTESGELWTWPHPGYAIPSRTGKTEKNAGEA